jgi:hypothetical protein
VLPSIRFVARTRRTGLLFFKQLILATKFSSEWRANVLLTRGGVGDNNVEESVIRPWGANDRGWGTEAGIGDREAGDYHQTARQVGFAFLTVILLTLLAFSFPGTAIAAKSDLIQKSNERRRRRPRDPLPVAPSPGQGLAGQRRGRASDLRPRDRDRRRHRPGADHLGPYVLDATKVTYNRRTDQFNAEGQVRIIDPGGTVLEADVAQIEDQFRNGFARHLRMLLTNDATLNGRLCRATGRQPRGLRTCHLHAVQILLLPNGVPFWQLKSATVEHDEALKRMYHHNVTLELAGIPVFWLPYLSHPDPSAKRASGFLTPTFFHSTDYGFGVETPYFFNLAPNYDLTVRPRFMTTDGVLAQATWRHRLDDGVYTVDAGGIYQTDTDLPPPGDRHFRGFVRTQAISASTEMDLGLGHHGHDRRHLHSVVTTSTRHRARQRRLSQPVSTTGTISRRAPISSKACSRTTMLPNSDRRPLFRHDYTVDRPIFGGILGFDTNIYGVFRQDR